MTTFYIYEVPGHKVGATKDWEARTRANINKYGIEPILIETMEGPNEPEYWQVVGDREWELADEKNYPRGRHYRHAREQRHEMNIRGASKGGLVGGAVTRDSGKLLIISSLGGKACRTTTFEIAEEIRSKYVPKKYTQGMLAKEYNLSIYTVTNIVKNRSYKTP